MADQAAAPKRQSPLTRALVAMLRLYQLGVSPMFGARCRFAPSCSEYAIEALREHGALRGSWLALRRLIRCQPFCAGGYDPVPARKARKGRGHRRHVGSDTRQISQYAAGPTGQPEAGVFVALHAVPASSSQPSDEPSRQEAGECLC